MPPPPRINNGDYHYHTYDYAGAVAWTPSAIPARNGWFFYSMAQDLLALQQFGAGRNVPNIALTDVGAPTLGNRRTKQLSFGSNDATAPTVVITGGIHAREWIAAEFVYLLAEYLVMHYETAPQNRYEWTIHDLVNTRRIRIIPMLNPDGNHVTVYGPNEGDRNQRKNLRVLPTTPALWVGELAPGGVANPPFQNVAAGVAQAAYDVPDFAHGVPPGAANYRTRQLANDAIGVDLNRNLDADAWGYECVPDDPDRRPNALPRSDSYFGTRRVSELESGNLQTAVAQATNPANPDIATSIDYHSYAQVILYPSETVENDAVGPDYESLGKTLQQLIRAQGATVPDYRLGSPQQTLGYSGTGSVMDHLAQRYHARAFTIELDPSGDQGYAGFNLPETAIRGVFEKNIRAALAAISAPGRPGNWAMAQFQRISIAWDESEYFDWNVYGRGNHLPA